MNMLTTRYILLLILFFNSVTAYALNLSAVVDRKRLSINESLRLIVTADTNTNQEIDFSQLNAYFDIINTQRSIRRSNVNGQITTSTQWVLILTPKEGGRLLIPSFELNGSYSQPLTITVEQGNNNSGAKSNTDVFLQASVNKKSVYVQEQVLLRLRLYYRIGLSSYSEDELTLGNVTSAVVSEGNFEAQINNKNYSVFEKVYALHPQSSGELIIPENAWRLEKATRSLSFGRLGNPYIYVKSKPIRVDVKPIPSQHQAEHWLPSTAVTLDTEWQQSLTQASVGEPLNLKLILTANGLSASQLPTITIGDNDYFTIYSDLPESDNTESAAGIMGTRTSNFAIIPKKAGKLSFPSVELGWWNSSTDKQETILIPEQTIIVSNSKLNKQHALPTLAENELGTKPEHTQTKPLWLWQATTAVFAFVCLALLYFYRQNRKKIFNKTTSNTDAKPYFLSQSDSKPTIKHSIKLMQTACADKNWHRFRSAVISWGKIILQDNELQSLQAISQHFPELDKPLKQLDNQLYANHADDSWNPTRLVAAIKILSTNAAKHKQQKQQLLELYNTH
ncbi:MAG: BatD family protein [Pseudomonadota bacterium]